MKTKDATPISSADAMQMIADAFNEPVTDIRPERLRETLLGWDSMGALMLIAEIDERFGIELSAEASRGMKSVEDILKFLGEQGFIQD